MSGPRDHFMEGSPLDQFDPKYPMYDNQNAGLQRTSNPSTPYEGFGFWYRPESQENIYNPDTTFPQQPRTLSQSTMDMPLTLKHKRTRSGCFTCRQRRVKCDETKPICDRCRKGNRQCEFPSKSSSSKKSKQASPTSPTAERSRLDNEGIPASIKEESDEDGSDDEEDEPSPRQKNIANSPIQQLTMSQFPTSSAAPIITTSIQRSRGSTTNTPSLWRDMKPEVQTYLQFQREYLTHYHYAFKVDAEDFVHEELIILALRFEPLLYAVLAFAAYHHTVRLPDERAEFSSFWRYYCQSIVKLRQHLESNKTRDDLVLLTVLQLATFEEYMGDWNSLVSHHKAAFGILTSRYTPETIMETERGRKMFDWYIRLDVIAGLMAVRDAVLDRSWISYAYNWHERRSAHAGPDQLQHRLDFFTKAIELIAHDIAHLFAGASEILTSTDSDRLQNFSIEELVSGVDSLDRTLDNLRRKIQELHDPSLAGAEQKSSPYADDSLFKPDVPLFRGPLWPLNFVWVDWYAVLILLKNSMLATLQKAQMVAQENSLQSPKIELLQQQAITVLPELTRHSKDQCEIYNAIAMSTTAPAGVTLVCYAAFALSTVFLPKTPPAENSRYTTWARQQLANFERQGFIWPPHFRKEIANLWSIPEIEDWWLPDGEGKSRIIDEIRAVVVERSLIAQRKEKPGSDKGRDLREIKGLFEMMDLGRRGSIDPSYLSSPTASNAAGMIGTPTSSASSVSGFTSPRGGITDLQTGNQQVGNRRQSQGSTNINTAESTVIQSRPAPSSSRMSGMWEAEPE